MTTSKSLAIKYVGDASGVKKALGQIDSMHSTFSSKLKSVGEGMKKTGKTMSAAITAPLVGFGVLAIKEFAEFQQVQGQTRAALKSTGSAAHVTLQHVDDLSKSIGQLSAQDGEQVQAAENVLLTFTKIKNTKLNATFDQASLAAANLSARMGTALPGAMKLVGKALNDPVKGMTALTRVGVQFTDHQKNVIKKMVETGHAADAQQLILGQLNVKFGGSAAAAGKAASPLVKMNLAVRDLAQSAGQFLKPILESVANFLRRVADGFANLSPHVQKMIVIAGVLAAALGPLLVMFGMMAVAISAISAPMLIVAAALIGLGVAAFFVIKHWQTVKSVSMTVWHAVQHAVVTVINAISKAIHSTVGKVIVGIFKTAWGIIKTVTMLEFALIQLAVIRPIQALWKFIGPILHIFARNWHTIWNAMSDVFGAVWRNLLIIARPVLNVLIDLLNALLHGINAVIHGFNLIPGHSDVPTIPTIPHLAAGTKFFGGGMALVGERGPEVVSLPRGSAVYPNGSGGGGATYNVTVNIPNGYGTDPRALAEIIRRQLLLAARSNGGKVGLS